MFIFLHCTSETCMNVVFIRNNLRSPFFPHFAPIQVFRHDNTNLGLPHFMQTVKMQNTKFQITCS